jgi:branched-chain amino acid transport system substrate-binding protein
MITRRRFLAGAGGLAAVAAGPTVSRAQAPLKLGELAGLTGPIAVYGQCVHNARKMAIEEINARGGVSVRGARRTLEMTHLDVGSPKEAVQVFERLLTIEKVKIVVDGLYSSVEYALGPVLKTKDALVLWSAGNDPATTHGIPNAFRNSMDGGLPLMRVTETLLKRQNVRRVCTYGQTGHADFKRFVEEYLPKVPGIEVLSQDWHPFGEKDFFPILTKIKGLKPDAVLTHGFFTDGVAMLKQAREIGLVPGPLWLNQYGAAPLMMDETSRRYFEGTYENLFASFAVTTEAPENSQRFFQHYARKFGEKGFSIWAEHAWDSIFLVAKAVEKAGVTDDVPRLVQAMSDLTTDEIPELLSPYKPGKVFDGDRQAYPKIIVAQWQNSRLVPVYSDYGLA